jgi:hypothetical protein
MLNLARALLGTLAIALSATAVATPVTFAIGPSSSASVVYDGGALCDLTGCGVNASLNSALAGSSRTLSAGQSWTFDFFSLNFYGLGGGTGTISALLDLAAPIGVFDAPGSGWGNFATAFLFTGGNLYWTHQPGDFLLPDGTSYSVFFENLSGITLGHRVNVTARLTLNSEPDGVPEPSTLGLFGLGLLGLGQAVRRRAKRAS